MITAGSGNARSALQWGRRSKTAGEPSGHGTQPGLTRASMGPPFEDGGETPTTSRHGNPTGASMGPPFENGGEARAKVRAGPKKRASNGAAVRKRRRANRVMATDSNAELQWGRRSKTAESSGRGMGAGHRELAASMGPPFEDGGGQGVPVLQIPRAARFNGAAVRRRRRAAPMRADSPTTASFNGAAVRRRRRVHQGYDKGALRWGFQWGHRSKTAERSDAYLVGHRFLP